MLSRFYELTHFIPKTKFKVPSLCIRLFTKGGSKKTKLEIHKVKALKNHRDTKSNDTSSNKELPPSERGDKNYGLYVVAGSLLAYALTNIANNVYRVRGITTVTQDEFINEYLINGEVQKVIILGPIASFISGINAEVILFNDSDRMFQKVGLVGIPNTRIHTLIHNKEKELNIPRNEGIFLLAEMNEIYIVAAIILFQMIASKKFKLNFRGEIKKMSELNKKETYKEGVYQKRAEHPRYPSPMDLFTDTIADTASEELNMKSNIKFKDVAGLHGAKQEVKEFLDYLNNPTRFIRLGARLPRGAMLLGPPGCGKTLLVKALSNESNVPFFYKAGSEITDKLGGVGAKRLRKLFERARLVAPAIIFLDEIDAVGKKRGATLNQAGFNDGDQTLNQLLVEMDGMDPNAGVIVFAATNRVDILDDALTRPGRFDRHILIDLPILEERKEIFQLYLTKNKKNLESNIEELRDSLASQTPGMSGADIANLCNEAALTAARLSLKTITNSCFEMALERIVVGAAKKNKILNEKERNVVAYHEAGHVLVGWLLKYADPILKVSIVPRTNADLGFSQLAPSDKYLQTVDRLTDRITVLLGGRAAESIVFNSVTSGALDDLQKVKKIAFSMVRELGMSEKLGHISYTVSESDEVYENYPYSKNTRELIDSEANFIVTKAYRRAEAVLKANKEKLELIAKELMIKEMLNYADIQNLIGARPHDSSSDYV